MLPLVAFIRRLLGVVTRQPGEQPFEIEVNFTDFHLKAFDFFPEGSFTDSAGLRLRVDRPDVGHAHVLIFGRQLLGSRVGVVGESTSMTIKGGSVRTCGHLYARSTIPSGSRTLVGETCVGISTPALTFHSSSCEKNQALSKAGSSREQKLPSPALSTRRRCTPRPAESWRADSHRWRPRWSLPRQYLALRICAAPRYFPTKIPFGQMACTPTLPSTSWVMSRSTATLVN